MQILMIGNGFDIEHGLPTKYSDFLAFVSDFNEIVDENSKSSILKVKDKRRREYFQSIFNEDNNNIVEKFSNLVHDNVWIEYFQKNKVYLNDNWIDFESEISNIIRLLEKAREKYIKTAIFHDEQLDKSLEYDKYINEMYSNHEKIVYTVTKNTFNSEKKKLLEDLKKIIEALEMYLVEYVGGIEILSYNPDIEKLTPHHIISFNYTNTYEKVYDNKNRNIHYDYIHGKALAEEGHFCNMVLGIDEYLSEEERSENVEFIEFQKYYQRMQKMTDNQYKILADEIVEGKKYKDGVELYIFGHSLDATDKDILRMFLLNDKIITTIYFYDRESYDRGIANLVKILGYEELQKRVYGKRSTIIFKIQSHSELISHSSFDVQNDIFKIYNISNYSMENMKNILHKIDKKILNKDTQYFRTQANVISIYDALNTWKLITPKTEKVLLDMAYSMSDINTLIIHNAEKWYDYDYSGEHGCAKETFKFINNINKYNKAIAKNMDNEFQCLTEDDIVRIYKNNDNLDENIYKKILNKLLFCDNGDYIKALCNITYANMDMAVDVIREEMKMNKNRIKRVKLLWLYRCCKEEEFYMQQKRAYEQMNDDE